MPKKHPLSLDKKTVAVDRQDIRYIDKLYRIGIPKQYFTDTQTEYPALFHISWDDTHVLRLTPFPRDRYQCYLCGRHSDDTIGLYDKRVCPTCVRVLAEKIQEASHVG